jgi:hypothetical protein
MRPPLWHPPRALSMAERPIRKRMRRAKLLVCLRHQRHELCTEDGAPSLGADGGGRGGQGRLGGAPVAGRAGEEAAGGRGAGRRPL